MDQLSSDSSMKISADESKANTQGKRGKRETRGQSKHETNDTGNTIRCDLREDTENHKENLANDGEGNEDLRGYGNNIDDEGELRDVVGLKDVVVLEDKDLVTEDKSDLHPEENVANVGDLIGLEKYVDQHGESVARSDDENLDDGKMVVDDAQTVTVSYGDSVGTEDLMDNDRDIDDNVCEDGKPYLSGANSKPKDISGSDENGGISGPTEDQANIRRGKKDISGSDDNGGISGPTKNQVKTRRGKKNISGSDDDGKISGPTEDQANTRRRKKNITGRYDNGGISGPTADQANIRRGKATKVNEQYPKWSCVLSYEPYDIVLYKPSLQNIFRLLLRVCFDQSALQCWCLKAGLHLSIFGGADDAFKLNISQIVPTKSQC